jgi:LPS-assembly protein
MLTASASYRSDSAVMRDFRNNIFNENQLPDSFAEATYAGDNYLISAFTRLNLNDYQLIQERLPEVRFDLLPMPVANLGIYQKGNISYVRLKEDYNTIPVIAPESTYQRYDKLELNYQITRPILLKNWLTLTPLLGTRLTHYSNFESTPQSTSQNNTVDRFEVGFDLEANGHSTFTTQNSVWKIDGLRHTIRPIVRYRYFSHSQNTEALRKIERSAYSLNRPLLELNDLRNLDTIGKTHLVRLGVENLFQTRAKEYGSRTLAALNFYQDILIAREVAQNNGNQPDTLHATWVEFALNPAPWLKFDLAARLKTSKVSLEELLTRTSLISGDSWQLSLSTDLLQSQLDQYRLHFIYRLSDSYSFLAKTRYNADKGVFDYTKIGLLTHLGSAWELLYGFTFRNDAARESDLEFSVGLKLVEP